MVASGKHSGSTEGVLSVSDHVGSNTFKPGTISSPSKVEDVIIWLI